MLYAIKKVTLIDESQSLENEIATLKSCNFPFIVNYCGAEKNGGELWVGLGRLRNVQIIMEYCHCGSLASYMRNANRLNEDELREITSCCLLGLNYLHNTKKIVHRVCEEWWRLWDRTSSQTICSSPRRE